MIFYIIFFVIWVYGGFSFSKSLIRTVIILELIAIGINLFFYGELVLSLIQLASLVATMWVYGNAEGKKVRFTWFFTLLTFILPIIGLPLYLILRNKLSRLEVVRHDGGKIEFTK